MLKKTGTLLSEAAAAHADALAPVLDKYSIDSTEIATGLSRQRPVPSSCVVHDNARPTTVVQMDIDEEIVSGLKRELEIRSKIDAVINASMTVGTYFPLSTQFENSVLFLPSAKRFFERNKSLVHRLFPDVASVHVNAFVVPAGGKPYGAHNAGSLAFELPTLAKRGLGYPRQHVSFHTALTPTPLERQPLAIFEDAPVESPNIGFLYEKLKSFDLADAESQTIDKAFFLCTSGRLSQIDLPTVRDFMLCKYWAKQFAGDRDSAGYFGELRPGQAVFFDNYRPHGDMTLPTSQEPRVTIDMRCFARVEYPDGMSSGIDFVLNPDKREEQRRRKRQGLECLLLLFGYDSFDEFLDSIYGKHDIDPFDVIPDVQFGVYNTGEHYLLEQDLDAHYDRCETLYRQIERDGQFVLSDKASDALARMNAL